MTPAIHLIVQYCNASTPSRQDEYDYCLRRNLNNPHIIKIHNLIEPQTKVPEEFRDHKKYFEHPLGRWMTYADALEYASTNLPGQIACLSNLDIFLDDEKTDWSQVALFVDQSIVLCLSRIEFDGRGKTYKDPGFEKLAFANTQDVWIFRSPFQTPESDFEIGTLGCDNAFADRIRRAGRMPLNAATRFPIFHFDQCRGKSFANQAEVHAADRAHRPRRRPEDAGQYLVPDFDQVQSVDVVLKSLNVPDLQR